MAPPAFHPFFVHPAIAVGLLLAAPLFVRAQDETSPTLSSFPGTAYPAFVGTVEEEPTTEMDDALTTEALGADVLIGDDLSTETWVAARQRIEPGIEQIRILFLTGASPEDFDRQLAVLQDDIDLLLRMAPSQAPIQQGGLEYYGRRLMRQVEVMVDEFEEGDSRSVERLDETIRRTLKDWNDLLVRSDLDRGSDVMDLAKLPQGWEPGEFENRSFAEIIAGWDTRRLLSAYGERFRLISRSVEREVASGDVQAAQEMGELARELAQRLYEVPTSSRTPFRNAALRLDVLAENLHGYLQDRNRLYARQQLRAIKRGIEDVDRFLALKERGL